MEHMSELRVGKSGQQYSGPTVAHETSDAFSVFW